MNNFVFKSTTNIMKEDLIKLLMLIKKKKKEGLILGNAGSHHWNRKCCRLAVSPPTHFIGLKKGGGGNDNNNAPGCQLSIWVAETLTKQYWDWDSAGVTGDELIEKHAEGEDPWNTSA